MEKKKIIKELIIIFWVFIIGSILGYIFEMIVVLFQKGYFESRQGLIYGPFTPVYGIGGIVYYIVFKLIKTREKSKVFLISMLLGGITEYLCSYIQEKAYISGINEGERNTIKKLFIKLLKEKAKAMNALLVLSCNYKEEIDEQFISTRYYMYISKSKAGTQYLDSLSGQATISDEGQYKVNTFLIWQPKEDGDSIFEGNIF